MRVSIDCSENVRDDRERGGGYPPSSSIPCKRLEIVICGITSTFLRHPYDTGLLNDGGDERRFTPKVEGRRSCGWGGCGLVTSVSRDKD